MDSALSLYRENKSPLMQNARGQDIINRSWLDEPFDPFTSGSSRNLYATFIPYDQSHAN